MEGGNGGADAPNDLFLMTAEYKDASPDNRIRMCQEWLDLKDNHGHILRRFVELALADAEERALADAATTQRLQALQAQLAQFPSLEELARMHIIVRNETASSAHVNTKHQPANYRLFKESIPDVELPPGFWGHRTGFEFPRKGIDSEFGVNAKTWQLLDTIVKALGLKNDLSSMLDVPIMDTAPDVTLVTDCNKLIVGVVEGKKPPKTESEKEKMFGTNTPVAGEVFEQLFLSHIQNETFSVGLISTLGSFQLISTVDVSKRTGPLTPDDAIKYFTDLQAEDSLEKPTPDKRKVLVDESGQSTASKKTKVEMTKAPSKNVATQTKRGRVAVAIEEAGIEREYFASEVFQFGNDETQNREVFELLAAYVLLCVEAYREAPKTPLDLTKPGARCLTRQVKKDSFAFKHIKLPSGLQFHAQPSKDESTFYAARQLGYGNSGASCFACTSNSAPCVIKFYRREDVFEEAKSEANKWQTLYGEDYEIDFVRAFESPRIFLVMPYLSIPCNLEERQRFVEGGEDSMLYKALEHLSSKGFIHEEVRWHHIGAWKVKVPPSGKPGFLTKLVSSLTGQKRGASTQETTNTGVEVAVFCDLAHATRTSCETKEKRQEWVKDQFNEMRKRIGEEQNARPQIQECAMGPQGSRE